jgi:putative ABC transport system permease protein
MLGNALLLAFGQLARNRVRAALTSLGVLIGVAAVISMLSLGRGATRAVNEDLEAFGQNLLFVIPGDVRGPGRGAGAKPFTDSDVDAVRAQLAHTAAVAPTGSSGTIAVYGDASWTTTVTGITPDYLTAMRWDIESGRTFEDGELLAGADVCLLGRTVVNELFGAEPPLDRQVRLDKLSCRVVGVLAPKGESTFGSDQDDFVLVPLRTFQRRIAGTTDIGFVVVSLEDGADTAQAKSDLEALFRQRRHIRPGADDDFQVRDMAEMISTLQRIASVLTGFLAAIAAVSLLVGGIGIMNIMLVSVTERTREIGIRLAIGARAKDVLVQFLVEAMVLSGFGGVLGVLLGVLLSWVGSQILDVPLVVEAQVVGVALVFSATIGVLFGYFPARHAARLHPIEALRYE